MEKREKIVGIILSAGKGKRMNSTVSKQYMDLCGKPVIYYAIKAFEESNVDEIVLVTGKDDIEYCRTHIIEEFHFDKVKKIVIGGKERYNSVHNALMSIDDASYVMIHDGARAFITPEIINNLIEHVKKYDACVAGVPAKDTIKIVDSDGVVVSTPPRETVWQVQTPQCFEYNIIRKAYDEIVGHDDGSISITDDAMVLETYNKILINDIHNADVNHDESHNLHIYNKKVDVRMVMASYENIKVTTPEDILFGETIIKRREMA